MMAGYIGNIRDAAARSTASPAASHRLGYLLALGLIGLAVIAVGYVLIEACNYLGNLWDGAGGWTVLAAGLGIAVLGLAKHNGGVALFGILVMVVDLTGLIFHLPAWPAATPARGALRRTARHGLWADSACLPGQVARKGGETAAWKYDPPRTRPVAARGDHTSREGAI